MNHRTTAVRARAYHSASRPREDRSARPSPLVDRHVGQQIKLWRLQLNISQADLGKGIGVSMQQIQKYEAGKNRVSASTLYAVAKCLNVSIATFFDGLPVAEDTQHVFRAIEVDERLTYVSTVEGRRLIDDMLLLEPRVRSKFIAFLGALAEQGV